MGKVPKERRKIRKGFVKGGDIDVGWLGEVLADAIDHGMRDFMRNDIVR